MGNRKVVKPTARVGWILFLLMRTCTKRSAVQRQTSAALSSPWTFKNNAWEQEVGFYFRRVFKISLLQSKLSQCTCTDRALCATKISYFSNLDPKDICLAFTEIYESMAPNSDTSHIRAVDKSLAIIVSVIHTHLYWGVKEAKLDLENVE